MNQLDNSLPDLTHITSREVTHMYYRSCYDCYLGWLHLRYRGRLRHQMMMLGLDEFEVFTIVYFI
jgi:hypothetical protein